MDIIADVIRQVVIMETFRIPKSYIKEFRKRMAPPKKGAIPALTSCLDCPLYSRGPEVGVERRPCEPSIIYDNGLTARVFRRRIPLFFGGLHAGIEKLCKPEVVQLTKELYRFDGEYFRSAS